VRFQEWQIWAVARRIGAIRGLSARLKTAEGSTDLFFYGQPRPESDSLHAVAIGRKSKDRARAFLLPSRTGKLNSLKGWYLWVAVGALGGHLHK